MHFGVQLFQVLPVCYKNCSWKKEILIAYTTQDYFYICN